jgi:hypothetical protein
MAKSNEAEIIFQIDIQKGRCINCDGVLSSRVVICENCFHVFCCLNCKDEHNVYTGFYLRDLTDRERNAGKKKESDSTRIEVITRSAPPNIITNQYKPEWREAQLAREKECEKSLTWIYGLGREKPKKKYAKKS